MKYQDGNRIAFPFPFPGSLLAVRRQPLFQRLLRVDLGARFVLLLFGVAALTVSRSASFIGQVPPDSVEPQFPPLIWVFHQADALFLPGVSRLPGSTPIAYIQCFALAVSLGCFFLAVRSSVPALVIRLHRPLVGAAFVIAALLVVLNLQGTLPYSRVIGQPTHYGNDAISVTSCATDAFLSGQNPYSQFRVIPCLSKYFDARMVPIKTTPLQAGAFLHTNRYPSATQLALQFHMAQVSKQAYPAEFESYYSYPAASFLLPALFVVLQVHDLSVFYLLCYLAIAALVIWQARGAARWVAVLLVAANAALWPTVSAGATDSLYALLILLAWIWRDKRWMSALLLGLAAASRQQAWFYVLFYAVLIARTMGRRELLYRLGIVCAVFTALNLPYLIASPEPWLLGVLGPMRDPMFPRGTGIIALSIFGAGSLPIGPRIVYTVLEAAALGVSLWYYWRSCRVHPDTGLVLAPFALFFAWRSLYSYFLPLSLLVLYPALTDSREPTEPVKATVPDAGAAEGGSAIVAA